MQELRGGLAQPVIIIDLLLHDVARFYFSEATGSKLLM